VPPSARLIRVYGDSLALPRSADAIGYRETFPELVRQAWEAADPRQLVHLYNRSRRGATIASLLTDCWMDAEAFGSAGGDLCLLQCGVCDCGPRPVPRWLRNRIDRLPGRVKRRIIRFLHDHRARILRAGLAWRDTPPEEFRRLYQEFLAGVVKEFRRVVAINIAPTTEAMDRHSPGLAASIERYNGLIREAVAAVGGENLRLADVYGAITGTPGGIERHVNASDGHHITAEGHRLYARLILEAAPAVEPAGFVEEPVLKESAVPAAGRVGAA
jgi:lysophospholipase L1-like esterase